MVLVDKGEIISLQTIKKLQNVVGSVTVNWMLDDPIVFNNISRKIAPAYDYVFTNSIECVPLYHEIGVEKVKYLPFGCDPTLHKTVSLIRDDFLRFKSEICFIGAIHPKRIHTLSSLVGHNLKIWGRGWNKLCNKHPLKKHWMGVLKGPVCTSDVVKAYNATNIGLNIQKDTLCTVTRIWEITACGALLLTEYVSGLDQHFKIGKEIICFRNAKELAELVDYYLNNQDELKKIAKRGQARSLHDHTIKKRIQDMLAFVT